MFFPPKWLRCDMDRAHKPWERTIPSYGFSKCTAPSACSIDLCSKWAPPPHCSQWVSPAPRCTLTRKSPGKKQKLFGSKTRWLSGDNYTRTQQLTYSKCMAGILAAAQDQDSEDVVPNKVVMLVVALVIFHLGVLVSLNNITSILYYVCVIDMEYCCL